MVLWMGATGLLRVGIRIKGCDFNSASASIREVVSLLIVMIFVFRMLKQAPDLYLPIYPTILSESCSPESDSTSASHTLLFAVSLPLPHPHHSPTLHRRSLALAPWSLRQGMISLTQRVAPSSSPFSRLAQLQSRYSSRAPTLCNPLIPGVYGLDTLTTIMSAYRANVSTQYTFSALTTSMSPSHVNLLFATSTAIYLPRLPPGTMYSSRILRSASIVDAKSIP